MNDLKITKIVFGEVNEKATVYLSNGSKLSFLTSVIIDECSVDSKTRYTIKGFI